MESLPKGERFTSPFFTPTIRPSIIGSMSVLRPKRSAHGQWPHIDNEKPSRDALSLQKSEEARFARLPQLPHSHELTLCDISGAGYLENEQERGTQVRKPDDLCSETNFRSGPDSNAFRRV
jgi:hypothetical protein